MSNIAILTRRGILGIFAAGFAPAAIRSGVLMPLRFERPTVLWGDGIRDDAEALQALLNGSRVLRPNGEVANMVLCGVMLRLSKTAYLPAGRQFTIKGCTIIGPQEPTFKVNGAHL